MPEFHAQKWQYKTYGYRTSATENPPSIVRYASQGGMTIYATNFAVREKGNAPPATKTDQLAEDQQLWKFSRRG